MIPSNITRHHVLDAIREIDRDGIPPARESRDFQLIFQGRNYPPKYVVSLANRFVNGKELDASEFITHEANRFIQRQGFEVVKARRPGQTIKPSSILKRPVSQTNFAHDERCPECKKTIEAMLRKTYGVVKSNYKFEISARIEDYKAFACYLDLQEVFTALQNHRGYQSFVRAMTLPHCDFFIPNPGFVLEFDESQHFTIPRRLSLAHYPDSLKVGFAKESWGRLCEQIQAKDRDPPFRDEQRAWYDTLRDFLPAIKGLHPTVRLYPKEMQWCSLDPKDTNDVQRFRRLIEVRRANPKGDFVATVVLQSNGVATNNTERRKALLEIIEKVVRETDKDGIILFPGGYYSAGKGKADPLFDFVEKQIGEALRKIERDIVVCLGIDGRVRKYAKDQIAIAVGKNGVRAIGRKFHYAPQERGHIELATNHLSKESGYSRIFDFNGNQYFLAACYDSFGIRQKLIPNPGVDVILDFIHGFHLKGEGGSGDVYFAKHGLAGAAKQWKCPAFGAAVFFNRDIPQNWPSGIYWNQGNRSTRSWRYKDNPVKAARSVSCSIPEGKALIRIYDLTDCLQVQ